MAPDLSSQRQFCPVFRPNKQEFSMPFCDYVREVCRKHPDIAMFKVVPPKGWAPSKTEAPDLQKIRITHPIKQHVIGTGGAFRCFLEEHKSVTAADFKKLAHSRGHAPPPQGHRHDELLERAFWSSVTINPPLYGADTPASLFDEDLEFGWNLHDLQDLLKEYDVPSIPGVTTPMTYFGMWKSFFSWHVEDVDLYSVNYLHFGAPKVWYCVSPKDRPKFESMAKNMFPELHSVCPSFMRHKDILFSPKLLRSYGVEYVQAKQEVGDFVVLNAGSYHSGFNLGFNCAEAVNFATADWLATGRAATRCTCAALPDSVRLDMGMFAHGPRLSQRKASAPESTSDDSEEEQADSADEESLGKALNAAKQKSSQQQLSKAALAKAALAKAAVRQLGKGALPNGKRAREAVLATHTHQSKAQSNGQLPSLKRQALAQTGSKSEASQPACQRSRSTSTQVPYAQSSPASPTPAAQPPTSHATADTQPGSFSPRQLRHLARTQPGHHTSSNAEQTQDQDSGLDVPVLPMGRHGSVIKAEPWCSTSGSVGAAAGMRKLPALPVRRKSGGQAEQQQQHTGDPPEWGVKTEGAMSPSRGGQGTANGSASAHSPNGRRPTSPRPKALLANSTSPKKRSGRNGPLHDQGHGGIAKRAYDWVLSLVGNAAQAAAAVPLPAAPPASPSAASPTESKVDGTRERPIALDSGVSLPAQQDPAAEHDDAMWPSLSRATNPPRRAPQGDVTVKRGALPSPKGAASKSPADPPPLDLLPDEKPMAIVGEEDGTNHKYFHLVQRIAGHAARGKARVRMLSEGPDSVFRPTGEEFEEASSALIPVRTCLVPPEGSMLGGFELKTLRSKILHTELL